MKFTITAFLIFILTFNVFGQERTNREKINFDTTSLILTEAIGWAYNSSLGEWVDYKNMMNNSSFYKKSILGDEYAMSQTDQNFIQLQIKQLNNNGKKYYILVVEKWRGAYEYPSLRQDWYTFKETYGYIFTEVEYKKLLNIENQTELKTQRTVSIGSKYQKYDETIFLAKIQTELSSEKSEYSQEYTFPILKSKEGLIRFYLPANFSKYSILKIDFEKQYFEVSKEEFSKLIIQ